jgi:hypothetical protein
VLPAAALKDVPKEIPQVDIDRWAIDTASVSRQAPYCWKLVASCDMNEESTVRWPSARKPRAI